MMMSCDRSWDARTEGAGKICLELNQPSFTEYQRTWASGDVGALARNVIPTRQARFSIFRLRQRQRLSPPSSAAYRSYSEAELHVSTMIRRTKTSQVSFDCESRSPIRVAITGAHQDGPANIAGSHRVPSVNFRIADVSSRPLAEVCRCRSSVRIAHRHDHGCQFRQLR